MERDLRPGTARFERLAEGVARAFGDVSKRCHTIGAHQLRAAGQNGAGIFAFTLSWNEFIYALTFVSSSENKTVPVGVVTELVEGDVYHWGPLMAGALLGSLPVAFVYSFFVEYYVSGMTGSVKE